MIPVLLFLALGLLVLTAGAELLVRGAGSLALRCGLSPLAIGLTVVAFGTSGPELAVSTKAALAGSGDIAIGNIVGSNIFNVAVILGLAALLCPLSVHLQVLRREMPIMLVVSTLFPLLIMTDGIWRIEAAALFAGIIVYTWFSVRLARRESLSADPIVADPTRLSVAIAMVTFGLTMLIVGARLMVDQAIVLAGLLGISEAVVGLTIVAAGTSMPELATSVVAAFRKQTDIAIGNIVGSNIFNILAIGGVAGLIAPPLKGAGVGWIDFGFMLGTSLLLLPLMWTGFSIKRWEGALLLVVYSIYLWLLWPADTSASSS